MIVALMHRQGESFLYLGLTDENLERLRAGEPIVKFPSTLPSSDQYDRVVIEYVTPERLAEFESMAVLQGAKVHGAGRA